LLGWPALFDQTPAADPSIIVGFQNDPPPSEFSKDRTLAFCIKVLEMPERDAHGVRDLLLHSLVNNCSHLSFPERFNVNLREEE
jgi:hypothetical protein